MFSIRAKPRAAFTLVEILVVVMILGITAAVVIPQIGNRDDLRAASMARSIVADLAYAQARAVSLQKPQYVWFDVTNKRYTLLDQFSPSQNIITHPVNRSPFQVQVGTTRKDSLKEVALDAVNFDSRAAVYFDELGAPHSFDPATGNTSALSAGFVRIKCRAYTLTITVEPYSGELKIN